MKPTPPAEFASTMQMEALPFDGAVLLTALAFDDDRGYFKEVYARSRYESLGIAEEFVQDNVSLSRRLTLRGLHGDPRMAKLVQVLAGRAYDVIVDARRRSVTFGRWLGFELRAEEHRQLYIPAGCLHGFLALQDGTLLSYKQSSEYDPSSEFGVAWDDPEIGIAWPLFGERPLLSKKDCGNPALRELGNLCS